MNNECLQSSCPKKVPILIGGTGRCGTTILKKILASHSKISSIPKELRVVVDPDGVLDVINVLSYRWDPYSGDKAIHRFKMVLDSCGSTNLVLIAFSKFCQKIGMSPPFYGSLGIGKWFGYNFYRSRSERLIKDITCHISNGWWLGSEPFQVPSKIYETGPYPHANIGKILRTFIEDLYVNLPDSKNCTHWLDDTPYNLLKARELFELFPDMKLIHIYRDPRDVIASTKAFHWGGDDIAAIAYRIASIHEQWSIIKKGLPDFVYKEVKMEDLIRDTNNQLESICSFMDLKLEPQLFKTPLNKGNIERWKNDLTKPDIEKVHLHLKSIIDKLGYHTE